MFEPTKQVLAFVFVAVEYETFLTNIAIKHNPTSLHRNSRMEDLKTFRPSL